MHIGNDLAVFTVTFLRTAGVSAGIIAPIIAGLAALAILRAIFALVGSVSKGCGELMTMWLRALAARRAGKRHTYRSRTGREELG